MIATYKLDNSRSYKRDALMSKDYFYKPKLNPFIVVQKKEMSVSSMSKTTFYEGANRYFSTA